MNGFWQRLAGQQPDPAGEIRPRLPGRFEPAGEEGTPDAGDDLIEEVGSRIAPRQSRSGAEQTFEIPQIEYRPPAELSQQPDTVSEPDRPGVKGRPPQRPQIQPQIRGRQEPEPGSPQPAAGQESRRLPDRPALPAEPVIIERLETIVERRTDRTVTVEEPSRLAVQGGQAVARPQPEESGGEERPAAPTLRQLLDRPGQAAEPEAVKESAPGLIRPAALRLARDAGALEQDTAKGAEESAPIIEITIGRIELRPASPQAAPAPPVRKRFEPTITLESYLQKRNGGER